VSLVRIEREGDAPVARVVMNRTEARNALSDAMLGELVRAFGDLATEDAVRAVILAGDGPDLCAGADLADVRVMDAERDFARSFEELVTAIETHPTPVIAEVHGAALGAGCQLVVACDLAVAAHDARVGIPSARLGLLINYENIERLVLAVGKKRAGELLFAARVVTGTEAAAWGLVNEAVPAADVRERAMGLATRIAELAPLSVRGSKRGIGAAWDRLTLQRGTEGERIADFDMMAAAALTSEDLREGIDAFLHRRPPSFKGR
jgi:enoyl-CoA hydratase/carnithine racemase